MAATPLVMTIPWTSTRRPVSTATAVPMTAAPSQMAAPPTRDNQPGGYLGKIIAVKNGLNDDQVLADVTGQLGRGRYDQGPPWRPVQEIGHGMVSEIGLQHVASGLWIKQPGTGDQFQQFRSRGGLSCSEGPVQPDDHPVMLRTHHPHLAAHCSRTVGWLGDRRISMANMLGESDRSLARSK
jgi:hypothetical protein